MAKRMPYKSILRNSVHPLADSPLHEFPLERHAFSPDPLDGEKCARCRRNRAMHCESDTVNPFHGVAVAQNSNP